MIDLTPHQKEALQAFLSEKYRQMIWLGAIRSGKTYGSALCMIMAGEKVDQPRDFILAGQSGGSVLRNIVPYFMGIATDLGMDVKLTRGQQGNIRLVNTNGVTNTYWIFGGDKVDSQDRIQGMTCAGALLDEALLLHPTFIEQVIARSSLDNSIILMTGNMSNPFHPFKLEWVDKVEEKGIWYKESTLLDNPFISDDVRRGYEQAFSGTAASRWLNNLWVADSGMVFPEPNIITAHDHITCLECFVSMDWGPRGVTAGLLFCRIDEDTWLVSQDYEYDYAKERRPRDENETAAIVRAMWKEAKQVVVDPSAILLKRALHKAGMRALGGMNKVEPGIQAVNQAFAQQKLWVHADCLHLLSSLTGYAWDSKGEKPVKDGNDHFPDALRYGVCAIWPPKGRVVRFDWPYA